MTTLGTAGRQPLAPIKSLPSCQGLVMNLTHEALTESRLVVVTSGFKGTSSFKRLPELGCDRRQASVQITLDSHSLNFYLTQMSDDFLLGSIGDEQVINIDGVTVILAHRTGMSEHTYRVPVYQKDQAYEPEWNRKTLPVAYVPIPFPLSHRLHQ